MYDSLRRRGGSKRPAATYARRVPAGLHEGTVRDHLRRHALECAEAARGTRQQRTEFAACLLTRVADPRNLRAAVDHLACEGGPAPGPNGVRLMDLGDRERWDLARAFGDGIRSGRYAPGPHRSVKIPKGSGRGTRTLAIQDVEDRVVQRAIVQALQPFLDPMFAETSYGYRPGRARGHALATAEALARTSGRWCWILEDARDAFDQVPHRRLLDVLGVFIPAVDVLGLVEAVIRSDTARGLRQGGSLSPLLLNVYLHHHLDRPWTKAHPDTPLIRVADDLLVLCRDRNHAPRAREALVVRLRSAAMPLKGTPETAIVDLAAGETATWLGYTLHLGAQGLEPHLADSAWDALREHLVRTHDHPGSPIHANESIVGWIDQLGPCYPYVDVHEVHARITRTAKSLAFEEIPTCHEVRSKWEHAHDRWETIRHGRDDLDDRDGTIGGSARLHRLPAIAAEGGAPMAGAPPISSSPAGIPPQGDPPNHPTSSGESPATSPVPQVQATHEPGRSPC